MKSQAKSNKWAFCRKEVLGNPDDPYLVRWRLIGTPWFNVWLHNIRHSDVDSTHNHPWSFVSLILKGGYQEDIEYYGYVRQRIRKPLSVGYLNKNLFHKVTLFNEKPCWSLIFTGPKTREWGFMTEDGWVHNEEHNRKYAK